MKPQYKRITWHDKGGYEHRYIWYRRVRTFNENRQNTGAIADGYNVRGRRRKLPTVWDDQNPGFMYKKCWKRFTKRKHQWIPKAH